MFNDFKIEFKKIVIEKVRNHIFNFYEYNDLRNNIEALKHSNKSTYQAAQKLVEEGCFLVCYNDIREFIDSLKINNKNSQTLADEECLKMYINLLAREIAKILS